MSFSTSQLSSCLEKDFNRGKGLVPLIGAGVSVPAGIPTTPDLENYLTLCVVMALGLDEPTMLTGGRWHPQRNTWPLMRGDWLARARKGRAQLEIFRGLLEESLRDPVNQNDDDKNGRMARLKVYQQAEGALSDWRLALQFLSRLELPFPSSDKDEPLVPTFGDINPHVIDAFFNHITANKVPAMAHRMFAYFAEALRARITLTVNFDDLLEQAHREVGLDTQIFEVHQEAGLPPHSLLGRRHALVKLHGGKYGVRADVTLDREPSQQEYRHFRSYLLGRDWSQADERLLLADRQRGATRPPAQANLLVAGVSGSDRRVAMLVVDALRYLRGLKVYWLCHSSWDRENAPKALSRAGATNQELENVHFLKNPHVGTLLWEIFQHIKQSLPPSGVEFPVTWQLPLVPHVPEHEQPIPAVKERKAWDWRNQGESAQMSPPILYLISPDDPNREWGVSGFAWKLFRSWRTDSNCIWLDGENIEDCEDFKGRLFQAVCAALGEQHQAPPLLKSNSQQFIADLKGKLAQSSKDWFLFLNLRGYFGSNANMFAEVGHANESRSRISRPQIGSRQDTRNEEERLRRLVTTLVGQSNHLRGVLLIRRSAMRRNILRQCRVAFARAARGNWVKKRVKGALDWARARSGFRDRFLSALSLHPEIRHRSALVSRSIARPGSGSNFVWAGTNKAIEFLINQRLLREKPGGFLWMHPEIKHYLRERLKPGTSADLYQEHIQRQDLHLGLADWCMTFFFATRDPLALFQAIFHRCRVAELAFDCARDCAGRMTPGQTGRSTALLRREKQRFNRFMVRVRASLCEATNHLEAGRASILTWGNRRDAERCLEGFLRLLDKFDREDPFPRIEPQNAKHSCDSEDVQRRNMRFCYMAKAKVLLFKIWLARDLGDSQQVLKACEELGRLERPKRREGEEQEDKRQSFWAEKHHLLESAVACIALRCYEEAQERLDKICFQVGRACDANPLEARSAFPLRSIEKASGTAVEKLVSDWTHCLSSSNSTDVLRFDIRQLLFYVLRRKIETHLLQYEARETVNLSGKQRVRRLNHLEKAERLYLAARTLPRFFPEEEFSRMRPERSRLHSVYAGILACRRNEGLVQRHITEAWIAVEHLPESEEFIARSVVDLRRVYCKLHRLLHFKLVERFVKAMMTGCKRRVMLGLLKQKLHVEDVRQLQAVLGDSELILDRTEARMSRNRKSVWWWMTLRRYQMVCLQYRELVRCWKRWDPALLDPRENAAALNFAMQQDAETAQALLLETVRRVSLDAFQLARISHAALNIARLSLLSPRKENIDAKAPLKDLWKDCLSQAQQRMRLIKRQRGKVIKQTWKRSQDVESYIKIVSTQIASFVR